MKKQWLRSVVALLLCAAMLLPLVGCKPGESASDDDEPMVITDAEDAIEQLADTAEDYGYENAFSELTEKSIATIDGDSYYRLQQNYQGIPVYGRTVVCATDEEGNVTSLTGNVEDVYSDAALTPTITKADAETAIADYYAGTLSFDSTDIGDLTDENLCIYNLGEDMQARLAYRIPFNCRVFIIDATTADVLHSYSTVQEVTVSGYKASDTKREHPFNVEQYSEQEFVLEDIAHGITVKNLKGIASTVENSEKGTIWNLDKAENVVSDNNIFGDGQEAALGYENAVTLLENFLKFNEYFSGNVKIEKQSETGKFVLYYNDGYDNGCNARGGKDSIGNGILMMGSTTGVTDIDVIAHEYTHIITRANVDWTNSTIENYAINEAYSDIYGELVEAWYNGKANTPGWVIDLDNCSVILRNLRDPAATKTASTAIGIPNEFGMSDDDILSLGYKYSTVISHAAYLMWNGIDGTETKKISTDDLAKLWYRAMLMMPSDCDFNDCRQIVELAATSMKLTSKQIACVSEAFDTVGITGTPVESSDALYDLALDSTLSVYGGDGELYDNYTLTIIGKTAAIYGPVIEKVDNSYNRTIAITRAEPYELNLPKGIYTFKITDNANPSATKTFAVCVQNNDGESDLKIHTNFGSTPVKGTVSTRKEENGKETNVPIQNAVITVYHEDQETPVQTIQMTDQEDGFFEVYLPIGIYSFITEAEGYISSTTTFELTADKSEYLKIVLNPNVAYVTDAYAKDCTYTALMYNYETGKSEETEITCAYRIPQINLPGNDVARINEKIYNTLYPIIETCVMEIAEYSQPYTSNEVMYFWAVNGDLLSLVVRNSMYPDTSGGNEYMVYNVSVSSGEIVSNAAVLETAGFSQEEFYERAKQVLGSRFWSNWDPSNENFSNQSFVEFFNEQLKKTISDDNIAKSYPYLNENGQLCIIAKRYSLAAADYYWGDLNMIDFELSPYYASEASEITHAINISEEEAYQIACEYWSYTEGDIAPETGFELFVVPEYGKALRKDAKTGKYFYCYMLRWLVIGEDGDSWMATCDIIHVDAETGECTYFSS